MRSHIGMKLKHCNKVSISFNKVTEAVTLKSREDGEDTRTGSEADLPIMITRRIFSHIKDKLHQI